MSENRNTEDPPEGEPSVEEETETSTPPPDALEPPVEETETLVPPPDAPEPPVEETETSAPPPDAHEPPVEETETSAPPPDAPEPPVKERKTFFSRLVTFCTSAPAENDVEPEEEDDKDTSGEEVYTIDDAVNLGGYGKFQKYLTFLAGLGWLADAFEVIILSLLGDMIACDWKGTKRWQNALMTSLVFVGMAIGAPIFGSFADKYGRRTILAVSMFLLFVFGAASALSPNYVTIVILRAFMGFALGGIAQGVTLCCEYYPAQVRGRAGFYLSYYWAVGACGVVATAWVIMKFTNNWRWFLFIASIPALIVLISMKWYPESARYYVVTNQREKAVKTLKWMARMNKAEMPKGKLVEISHQQTGNITDLLRPNIRRQTLLFWYIWFSVACAYYGIALITPYIVTNKSLLDASRDANVSEESDFNAPLPCVNFTDAHFANMLWTTAAEVPGIVVFTFTIEFFSRKIFLGTTILFLAFMMLFLMLKMEPQVALLFILFVCRALVAAIFQLLFIMTTEAFPTTLRASAMGTGSSCARIGGFIIPFIAQVVVVTRPIPSMFALSALTALAGIAAFLLPLDTRGLHMKEVAWRPPEAEEQQP